MLKCKICESENMVIDPQCIMVCVDCGSIQDAILVAGTYKEEHQIRKYYYYNRLGHFREYLNHLQANEKTQIDNETIEELKQKFSQPISLRKLRKFVPKKYHRSLNKIIFLVWKVEPITISVKDCQEFEGRFKKVLTAASDFQLKHFIQLNYILYQLCILTNKTQYLQKIPLMKNSNTIIKYNSFWKRICEANNWAYVRYPF